MEFDVQGIRTVANSVLPDGAAKLQSAKERVDKAELAGDPFAESVPASIDGELMFEPTATAWNDAAAKLKEAMAATVAGIAYTCQTLNDAADTYQKTEFVNTERMDSISRLLEEGGGEP